MKGRVKKTHTNKCITKYRTIIRMIRNNTKKRGIKYQFDLATANIFVYDD